MKLIVYVSLARFKKIIHDNIATNKISIGLNINEIDVLFIFICYVIYAFLIGNNSIAANALPVKPCVAVISNLKTNYCIIGFTGMLAGVVFNKL